jgi:hypothetical protein
VKSLEQALQFGKQLWHDVLASMSDCLQEVHEARLADWQDEQLEPVHFTQFPFTKTKP